MSLESTAAGPRRTYQSSSSHFVAPARRRAGMCNAGRNIRCKLRLRMAGAGVGERATLWMDEGATAPWPPGAVNTEARELPWEDVFPSRTRQTGCVVEAFPPPNLPASSRGEFLVTSTHVKLVLRTPSHGRRSLPGFRPDSPVSARGQVSTSRLFSVCDGHRLFVGQPKDVSAVLMQGDC